MLKNEDDRSSSTLKSIEAAIASNTSLFLISRKIVREWLKQSGNIILWKLHHRLYILFLHHSTNDNDTCGIYPGGAGALHNHHPGGGVVLDSGHGGEQAIESLVVNIDCTTTGAVDDVWAWILDQVDITKEALERIQSNNDGDGGGDDKFVSAATWLSLVMWPHDSTQRERARESIIRWCASSGGSAKTRDEDSVMASRVQQWYDGWCGG